MVLALFLTNFFTLFSPFYYLPLPTPAPLQQSLLPPKKYNSTIVLTLFFTNFFISFSPLLFIFCLQYLPSWNYNALMTIPTAITKSIHIIQLYQSSSTILIQFSHCVFPFNYLFCLLYLSFISPHKSSHILLE